MVAVEWSADASLPGAGEPVRLFLLFYDAACCGIEPLCKGASDDDAHFRAVSARRNYAPGISTAIGSSISTAVKTTFGYGNTSATG